MDDRDFMNMALDLAERGQGYTTPNPMVGAVVVKAGKVVGAGYHQKAGGPHAEVNAINAAGDSARGATLYVTLEPCNHTGRTPPCTQKILTAGISQVHVAMKDPNPNVTGGGSDYLRARGLKVREGLCEERARKINESFIKYITTGRPFVIVKCAATLDGQIATRTGDAKWVTGPASRRFVHQLRHACDAIMVGIETVKRDDPSLTTRLEEIRGMDPVRIVLDTRLSIPENARLLHLTSSANTIIVTGPAVSAEKAARIERTGVKLLAAPLVDGRIALDPLMDQLGATGITSLLIEGGSRVICSAFQAGIVDKIFFFYAPKIAGGNDGFAICSGPGPERMDRCIGIRDTEVKCFDGDVMISGYVAKS